MIKLDVISGFLGAGKTTFIKQLISEKVFESERIVILENEYGEVNIDSKFLGQSKIPIYEITKGCICCSLKNDFVTTLNEIISLKPDRIIIEPSGIFMFETLTELLKSEQLKDSYRLNSVTSIVDVMLFTGEFIPMQGLIGNQIKHANIVLLSKTSSLNSINKENVVKFIKEYNLNTNIVVWEPSKPIKSLMMYLFDNSKNKSIDIDHKVNINNNHAHINTHQNVESETILITRPIKFDFFISFIISIGIS